MKKTLLCSKLLKLLSLSAIVSIHPVAMAKEKLDGQKESLSMKVEVRIGARLVKEELENVSYNADQTFFVGYYQEGWSEMISLHDAKTKKQLGSVSCGAGVATDFRFSRCHQFLGAKTSLGWTVYQIPSFDEVLVLGETDFVKVEHEMEKKNPVPKNYVDQRIQITAPCQSGKLSDAVYINLGKKKYRAELPKRLHTRQFKAGERAWIRLIGVCRNKKFGKPGFTAEHADGIIEVEKVISYHLQEGDKKEDRKREIKILKKEAKPE